MSGNVPTDGRGRGMRILRWVPFLVTILEVVVFVAVGRWIGFGWAIVAMLACGVAGMIALRVVGLSTWRRLREQAAGPGATAAQARDALAGVGTRIFGAFLLMAPGFVSSAVGALLLIPPVGRFMGGLMPSAILAGSVWRGRSAAQQPRGDVVEGEVVEVNVDDIDPPDRSASDYRDVIPLPEGRDE
jgi:UPF0716 family protein affecting phage T7 exclusion